MIEDALEYTRQAVALFFPDAKVIQRDSVIEIAHHGEIPTHFITSWANSVLKGYAVIVINRNLGLGKLQSPGMISDYLLGLYNDLCDKRDEAGIDRGWLDFYLYRMDHLYNFGDFMTDEEYVKYYAAKE